MNNTIFRTKKAGPLWMIVLAVVGFTGTALLLPQWLQTVPTIPDVLSFSVRDTVTGDTITLLQLPIRGDSLQDSLDIWNGSPACEIIPQRTDSTTLKRVEQLVRTCDAAATAQGIASCTSLLIPLAEAERPGVLHVRFRNDLQDKWRPTREVVLWLDPDPRAKAERTERSACVVIIPKKDAAGHKTLEMVAAMCDSLMKHSYGPVCRSLLFKLSGAPPNADPKALAQQGRGSVLRSSVGTFMLNRHPLLLFWLTMVSIMVAFAMGSAPLSWDLMSSLQEHFSLPKRVLIQNGLIAIVVVFALAVIPLGMRGVFTPDLMAEHFGVVFESPYALLAPVIITLFCSIGPITAMFTVSSCARDLDWSDEFPKKASRKRAKATKEGAVQETTPVPPDLKSKHESLQKLTSTLRACLSMLAALVVFAVITSGLLRESIMAWVEVRGLDLFPEKFVRVYGLMFAAFLAILYLPVRLHLRSVVVQVEKAGRDQGIELTERKDGPVAGSEPQDLKAVGAEALAQAEQQRAMGQGNPALQGDKAQPAPVPQVSVLPARAAATSPRPFLEKLGLTDLPWDEIRALVAMLSPILGSLIPEWLHTYID